jgi:hypothetical protein
MFIPLFFFLWFSFLLPNVYQFVPLLEEMFLLFQKIFKSLFLDFFAPGYVPYFLEMNRFSFFSQRFVPLIWENYFYNFLYLNDYFFPVMFIFVLGYTSYFVFYSETFDPLILENYFCKKLFLDFPCDVYLCSQIYI